VRAIQQQWLMAAAVFLTALCLYTRHNEFPFYYHPDEPSKVAQIRDGTRNFNHPLLLLNATDAARAVSGRSVDCQEIAEIGRTLSAVFAAIAAALFSWLGFNRFGVTGGVAAGVAMLIQRRLYEHAHFMKEDAALLAGIALTFLAIDAFWRRPTAARALLLGVATAVAVSGKYIGLLMLPFALAALVVAPSGSSGVLRRAVTFLAAFLVVFAVINHQAVLSVASLVGGFSGEIERLNSRAGVEQQDFSRIEWLRRFLDVSPFLLVLFAYQLTFVFRNFRRVALPDLLLAAFPFLLGITLSFSSKQSGRHALPALMVIVFLALMAAVRLWNEVPQRRALFAAFVGLAFIYDAVALSLMHRGFGRDHRRELVAWITANVPTHAAIAVEDRVGIPYEKSRRFCDLPPPLPQQVRGARFAADIGSLDELRANGITHVAVTPPQSEVFIDDEVGAKRAADPTFQRRREFYRRLFAEGRLVWSRETGNVGVLNPSLRLYQIAPSASSELNVGR
jgi:hypothetical protein